MQLSRQRFLVSFLSVFLLSACSGTREPVHSAPQPSDVTSHVWPTDTWPISTPAAQGIDAVAIDSIVADMRNGAYGLIDAFMLIRNGFVVANHRFEQDYEAVAANYDSTNHQFNYDHPEWHPYLKGTKLHTLQSVTKSVLSASFGIAIDRGHISGVDALAMPYFNGYEPYPTSARRDSTRLEDFLTMRSGIQWNSTGPYGTGEHSTDKLEASDTWIQYVLDQPTDTIPGVQYEYNDGASVLLGKIIRQATGKRTDVWANENLFEPIGIDDFYWKVTPDGESDTEGGLYLATEDLARIGYLFLRNGEWNGSQIVSEEWVRQSTSPVVADIAPGNANVDIGYGYQWWIPSAEGGVTKIFAANGYGGQFLIIVPEYDIVAVFNSWNIHGGNRLSTWRAVQQRILPSTVR